MTVHIVQNPLRVLSLGAGVQSSTLALMMTAGEVLTLDCAIFADTRAESDSTYRWLDWLEKRLSFPLHRVTAAQRPDRLCTGGRAGQ